MNREDGHSSNLGHNHYAQRYEHYENYVSDGIMIQDSSSWPTYSLPSYMYTPWWVCPILYPAPVYGPWHQFPGVYGGPSTEYSTCPLAERHGGLQGATESTSSWWNQPESSITSFTAGAMVWIQPVAARYMHGGNVRFPGLPQMPVSVHNPFISNQHQITNGTLTPNLRGRSHGHSEAAYRQLPAPPSQTAPRNSTLQVSGDASSRLGTRGRVTQVSTNALSGSGIVDEAPNDTGPPTSVAQQPQEADPVHETNLRYDLDLTTRVTFDDGVMILDILDHEEAVGNADSGMRIDVTLDRRTIDDILATMRSNTGLAEEIITGQLKTRTSEQPLTSRNSHEAASCVICLDGYVDKQVIGRLECGHEYHSNCIKNWLRVKNECPICKSQALPLK